MLFDSALNNVSSLISLINFHFRRWLRTCWLFPWQRCWAQALAKAFGKLPFGTWLEKCEKCSWQVCWVGKGERVTTCIEKERVTSQKFKLMKLWNWLAYYALMAPYKSLAWIVKFKILPGVPFSKGPVTFLAQWQILKSKPVE